MTQQLADLIERVKTWPTERQEDVVRVIEAMEESGSGIYHVSAEERQAIAVGRASPLVPEEEMEKFWNRHSI
jgi:hypothetical protein